MAVCAAPRGNQPPAPFLLPSGRFFFSAARGPGTNGRSAQCVGTMRADRSPPMPEDTSFRELMARVRAGDPHAALQLVRDYEWAIRLQVRVRLTQPDLRRLLDSLDVVQLVWASFFPRAAVGEFEL